MISLSTILLVCHNWLRGGRAKRGLYRYKLDVFDEFGACWTKRHAVDLETVVVEQGRVTGGQTPFELA